MRQTLFFIPNDILGQPLFGFGWLLALWLVGALVTFIYLIKQHGWTPDTKSFLPFAGIVAGAIAFLLPAVQVQVLPEQLGLLLWPTSMESPAGLPIRGYGIFLLIATVSGVMLASHRAKQQGLSTDVVFSLAFNMFVGGILGARVFYIVQKWDESIYVPGSVSQTLVNMVNFVEGGLVVYGSLIGALLAAVLFLRKQELPLLPIADLIAPSLALGLAIGRIGCLMNGCCYGGPCDHAWAITFPKESPPYADQMRSGQFHGFRLASDTHGRAVVSYVAEDGPAAKSQLEVGLRVDAVNGLTTESFSDAVRVLDQSGANLQLVSNGQSFYIEGHVPARSLPIHPTQIYSSINAALLCLLSLAYFPCRRRDGEVFALLMAGYAITRFLLEVIRVDELGIGGTGMTISQNVSVVMLVGAIALVIYLMKQPRTSFWPLADLR